MKYRTIFPRPKIRSDLFQVDNKYNFHDHIGRGLEYLGHDQDHDTQENKGGIQIIGIPYKVIHHHILQPSPNQDAIKYP